MLTARKKLLAVLAGCATMLVAPSLAQAAAITVTTDGDAGGGCTLRQAIESANTDTAIGTCTAGSGNDVVTIPGTVTSPIALTSELVAGNGSADALAINGPGASGLSVNAGGSNFRVLHVVGPVSVSGLTLTGGRATDGIGGGVFVQSGSLSLDHVIVTGNEATQSLTSGAATAFGGGIYADAPLSVVDSMVSSNAANALVVNTAPTDQAASTGAGVFATGSSAVTITRSAITSNGAAATAQTGSGGSLAAGGGAAVGNSGSGAVAITNSTISENATQALGSPAASTAGGGIFTQTSGTTTLTSDTLAKNTAESGANIAGASATTLRNTLITAPQPGSSANCDFAKTSGGFNLEGAFPVVSSCGLTQPTDQVVNPANTGVDPTLRSNGTHPLLAGSPAIDKGSAFGLTVDQLGLTRPVDFPGIANAAGGDGSDIGAFEFQQACAGQPIPNGPCTAAIQPDPTDLIFGDFLVGSASDPQTTTISSVGASDAEIGAVTLAGRDPGDFMISFDDCSSTTVAFGASCDIDVEFSPKSAGIKLARLIVPTNNAGAADATVGLRGNGTALPVTSPPPPPPATTGPTGRRAAAAQRCRKKHPKGPKRKRCLKRARKLPV